MSEIRTLTEFVLYCENTLGVRLPPGEQPEWKRRQIEVSKIKARQRKEGERKFSLHNLILTADYCRRRKIVVTSAVGVTYHVEDALKVAAKGEHDLSDFVTEAIRWERENGDLFSEGWIEQLRRARGSSLYAIYQEWQEFRGKRTSTGP